MVLLINSCCFLFSLKSLFFFSSTKIYHLLSYFTIIQHLGFTVGMIKLEGRLTGREGLGGRERKKSLNYVLNRNYGGASTGTFPWTVRWVNRWWTVLSLCFRSRVVMEAEAEAEAIQVSGIMSKTLFSILNSLFIFYYLLLESPVMSGFAYSKLLQEKCPYLFEHVW